MFGGGAEGVIGGLRKRRTEKEKCCKGDITR